MNMGPFMLFGWGQTEFATQYSEQSFALTREVPAFWGTAAHHSLFGVTSLLGVTSVL